MGRSISNITLTGDWFRDPAILAVFDLYQSAGFDLFHVGGSVRDDLMGRPVGDIDLATNATPQAGLALAEKAGFRVIPTGIDHGTITIISAGRPFEITSFRSDLDTDGRHATVAFEADLTTDAQRRDFTINALYADRDGAVIDLVGGLQDLTNRRLRFVGEPSKRIEEDYLRVLRYFRFSAVLQIDQFDADTLASIAAYLDGLEKLSKERITAEMLKLLSAPDPSQSVAVMRQVGVLARIMPGAEDTFLAPALHIEADLGLPPDPCLRLAALGGMEALRLSKKYSKHVGELQAGAVDMRSAAVLGFEMGDTKALQILALRAAVSSVPPNPQMLADVERGAQAEFPIKAADLSDRFHGKDLGAALSKAKADWFASDLKLDRAALLKTLN